MKKIFYLTVLLFLSSTSFAQKLAGAIKFNLGLPQGDFKIANDKVGFGGRFNFLYKPFEQAPVSVGAEVGMMVMGSRTERFRSNSFGFYDEYKINATSNVFSAFLNLRIDPVKMGAPVRPFIDGLLGWNNFYSTVTITRESFNNNNNFENSNSSKARWAMAYGGSIGVDIKLDAKGKTYLQLKNSFLQGNKTKYLTDPRIDNNGDAYFTEKESRTNMLLPQVGVFFQI